MPPPSSARTLRPAALRLPPLEFYQMIIDHGPDGVWPMRRRELLAAADRRRLRDPPLQQQRQQQRGPSGLSDRGGSQKLRRPLFSALESEVGSSYPASAPPTFPLPTPVPSMAPSSSSLTGESSRSFAGSVATTPRLHRAVIPKLYAIDSWRPRLSNLILPRYECMSVCMVSLPHIYIYWTRHRAPKRPAHTKRVSKRCLWQYGYPWATALLLYPGVWAGYRLIPRYRY